MHGYYDMVRRTCCCAPTTWIQLSPDAGFEPIFEPATAYMPSMSAMVVRDAEPSPMEPLLRMDVGMLVGMAIISLLLAILLTRSAKDPRYRR